MGRTGREGIGRQAYSMSAVDEYGSIIEDIYDFAEAQGLEIDTIIQEGGAAQIEINLSTATRSTWPTRSSCSSADPRGGALNGCLRHLHGQTDGRPAGLGHAHPQSVVSDETGENIFSDADGAPTRPSRLPRRPAERICRGHGAVCALRELLPPPDARLRRRRSIWTGARQPHRRPACPDLRPKRAGSRTASRGWTATPISASRPASPAGISA